MSLISDYKKGMEHFLRKEYAQAIDCFETGSAFGGSSKCLLMLGKCYEQGLGVDVDLKVDFCQEPFNDNDLLILCTDGLSNFVGTDDIINLTGDGCYYDYADRLVNLANQNGGGDNITVVAVSY